MSHKILVSNGEILDKLSILQIKRSHCDNPLQLSNINKEISILKPLYDIISHNQDIQNLYDKLYKINEKLWLIEDNIRLKEKLKIFDAEFIELARSVYLTNDTRSLIKKQINTLSASELIEEKIYKQYV